MSDKQSLRQQIRQHRRELHEQAGEPGWQQRAATIATQACARPEIADLSSGTIVASYESYGDEPPTHALNQALIDRGLRVALPVYKVHGQRLPTLKWLLDDKEFLDTASLVAAGCAVMVIPALSATPDGDRLGQGAGYYDRALETIDRATAGGPILLTIIGESDVRDELPIQPHDIRMDGVVVV